MTHHSLTFNAAPYRLSGTVIGSLMNDTASLAALGSCVNEPPYKAPPQGPILYVKPRNTLAQTGAQVVLPALTDQLEIGASLGLVIGRTACRVVEAEALDHVVGYTLVADLSVPHDSFYRPSIRFKALDGSCVIGPRVVLREEIEDPDKIALRVSLDAQCVHETNTSGMRRSAAKLIADVSEFMTLRPGDILMLGVGFGAPLASAGETFTIEAEGLGRLDGQVVSEHVGEVA